MMATEFLEVIEAGRMLRNVVEMLRCRRVGLEVEDLCVPRVYKGASGRKAVGPDELGGKRIQSSREGVSVALGSQLGQYLTIPV